MTPNERRDAEAWVSDCWDLDTSTISDQDLQQGIDNTYEGGWEAFVADMHPSDPSYMSDPMVRWGVVTDVNDPAFWELLGVAEHNVATVKSNVVDRIIAEVVSA